MGPACPACKTRLPFHRTQLDLGKPFACAGCEASLVVPRGQHWIFIFGLLVLFWVIKSRFAPGFLGTAILWLAVAAVGLPALYLKTHARLAQASDMKKPPKA